MRSKGTQILPEIRTGTCEKPLREQEKLWIFFLQAVLKIGLQSVGKRKYQDGML